MAHPWTTGQKNLYKAKTLNFIIAVTSRIYAHVRISRVRENSVHLSAETLKCLNTKAFSVDRRHGQAVDGTADGRRISR